MSAGLRLLGLDRRRWALVGATTLWPAMALVVTASLVIAWSRFGGLAIDAPRAFLRMVLVGVWGWLGLGAGISLVGRFLPAAMGPAAASRPVPSLERTLAAVGFGHLPVLLLGVVVLVGAGALQILGLGQVVAVVVFGFWFPALLVVATGAQFDLDLLRAVAVVAVPYGFWLAFVGRHLLDQVQHLL